MYRKGRALTKERMRCFRDSGSVADANQLSQNRITQNPKPLHEFPYEPPICILAQTTLSEFSTPRYNSLIAVIARLT